MWLGLGTETLKKNWEKSATCPIKKCDSCQHHQCRETCHVVETKKYVAQRHSKVT